MRAHLLFQKFVTALLDVQAVTPSPICAGVFGIVRTTAAWKQLVS
jgi:hypothetical protein